MSSDRMNKDILTLIKLYRRYVDEMISLLKLESENFNKYQGDDFRVGYFKSRNDVHFSFHGLGCLFKVDGKTIDIDFGEERYDRIDLWFLESFWESVKEEFSFESFEEVKNDIQKLLKEKFLINDSNSLNIFYLKEEWENPKIFEW